MTAGAYKPASPASDNGFNGYIAGTTLTVTSIASGSQATFTGSLSYPTAAFTGSIAGNVLTAGTPRPANRLLIGTSSISARGSVPANTYITANGTGATGTPARTS